MKRNINMHIFLCLLFLTASCEAKQDVHSKESLLNQKELEVQTALFYSNETELNRFNIELCLIQDCLIFEMSSNLKQEVFYDFIFLYIVYEAGYVDLNKLKEGKTVPLNFVSKALKDGQASMIKNKYISSSGCVNEVNKEYCVIAWLRDKYKIKKYDSHYDEGKKIIIYEQQ